MRQVIQHMQSGLTEIIHAPTPIVGDQSLLVSSQCSLISPGTERMLVGFGKASYLNKVRQQPDKVRMVLDKVAADGILSAAEAVQSKLSQPIQMGYSNVGIVIDIGKSVTGFSVGDRVISNGPHADIVNVSKRLCARIPDNVDNETAVFVVLASIGLQGIRLAKPSLGESFVVIGVGLIGLLTIQLLRSHGCKVLAVDHDNSRLSLAKQFGAEVCNSNLVKDPVSAGLAFSGSLGVDGVIIAASTPSSDPVKQAAQMCRKRGRIILVGVTGLELNRADFYEKELYFQVSCSYGPGRYDPDYEEKGQDYPLGFVRWTEQRNFEAVLELMARGQIKVKPLITHNFAFEEAPKAYEVLTSSSAGLGIMLNYTSPTAERMLREVDLNLEVKFKKKNPVIGFIGAGNYASRTLIPAFKKAGAQFHTIVTAGGINGVINGKKAGFVKTTSDYTLLLTNKEINTIVIVTRHDTHADFIKKALQARRNVFVEKPIAIDRKSLEMVRNAYYSPQLKSPNDRPQLMVGFNRRFSPHVKKMKSLLSFVSFPKSFIMTMNAGEIPKDHWTQDTTIGGGRIIGECCHYIDLMRFLVGSKIVSVQARRMGKVPSIQVVEDKASITLGFADGSFGTILYLANGGNRFPKERIEVFTSGSILQLDNFRVLRGFNWPGFKRMGSWRQDKGQRACVEAFLKAVQVGIPAIPVDEIFEVAEVTLKISDLLRNQ